MPDTMSETEPLRLQSRIRYRSVDGEGVVLHLDTGRVMVVNEVGLRIVELLREPMLTSELAAAIAEEFEVTLNQAESDIGSFLEELHAEEVLASGASR